MTPDVPSDTALMQDPAFAAALRACGQTPLMLPCGLMLLSRRIFGCRVNMLPRAAPPTDLADQLRAVGQHRAPLILSPETPIDLPLALRIAAPLQRAVLDLSLDADLLRARLHPKWRNQLVRAEKSELTVQQNVMRPDPLHPLLMMEREQARQRGYGNWPAPLTAAFAAAAPLQARLFSAHLHGRPVAHMLFLRHGGRASYHIGHISAAGKTARAHNLLLWRAMATLALQGVTNLDLGVLDPRNPGLSRFKQRTGAMAVDTGGTWMRWTPLCRPLRPARFHGFLPPGRDRIQERQP